MSSPENDPPVRLPRNRRYRPSSTKPVVIGALIGVVLGVLYCLAMVMDSTSMYRGQYLRFLSGILVGATVGGLIGQLFFREPSRLDE